jgi:hypothetical protein
MKAYRKKTPDILAFQWFPEMREVGGVVTAKTYAGAAFPGSPISKIVNSENVYVVIGKGGNPIPVFSGDYIVTLPTGEQQVYEPARFNAMYEEVTA